MSHIALFLIRENFNPRREYAVYAYLNTNEQFMVCLGTEKKCQQFIKKKLRWQAISQWIGYLVAGTLGAVLAAVITVVLTRVFLGN